MKEQDPIHSLLQEWKAPEPSAGLDARVQTAYRAVYRPSRWRRLWTIRISIPVPVFAALLAVVGAAWWLQSHSRLHEGLPPLAAPADGGYVTRIEMAGYQPLPDGATRVIRAGKDAQ